jgi:hypothetical protein
MRERTRKAAAQTQRSHRQQQRCDSPQSRPHRARAPHPRRGVLAGRGHASGTQQIGKGKVSEQLSQLISTHAQAGRSRPPALALRLALPACATALLLYLLSRGALVRILVLISHAHPFI